MRKCVVGVTPSEENYASPLNCLRLVSECLASSPSDLSLTIIFSLKATFPSRESNQKVYWKNIRNALGFIRNATVLNEQARVGCRENILMFNTI